MKYILFLILFTSQDLNCTANALDNITHCNDEDISKNIAYYCSLPG